ncbi:hypothetical protein [Sinomicrobium soli]|uniref:hypothetical protein n=1 Tax=Sinomicrobium sp. N-1-3-6 TaxID=2219864 RepID=UPI001374A2A6|nr:hypothetical protein [Sinomicrobium sp. N-1-3-6]
MYLTKESFLRIARPVVVFLMICIMGISYGCRDEDDDAVYEEEKEAAADTVSRQP